MSDHFLRLSINCDWATKEFSCAAKDSDDVTVSPCRWFCTTCEEECSCGVETWTNHLDYCREIEGWFDSVDLEECYEGEPTEFRSGRVEFVWDGNGYFWHYAPEPEPTEPLFELMVDGQILQGNEATK
jgi:hypothetical protein